MDESSTVERKAVMSLSTRQQKILDFIRRFSREHGFPPTIREIGQQVGISSTSVVSYNLNALEKKNRIERDRSVSRGLRLVEDPELGGHGGMLDLVRVPLLGRIVAGEPIPAPDDPGAYADETVDLALGMLSDTEDVYALQVQGDSMIDALVNSGDIVLLKYQQDARNGDMVAAFLRDKHETTLKHFYLEGSQVRLQPANPFMEPIFEPARNVEIQGRVIMVLRQMD
jgi:repressor LexA